MTKAHKDSAEVVRFLALFSQLREWGDDMPEQLASAAVNDSSVKDLCIALSVAAHLLRMNERRVRALLLAPADPKFIAAWREYESRYEQVVSEIWLSDLLPEFGGAVVQKANKADLDWDNAEEEASEQAGGIEEAIEFARFNADQDDRWDESQAKFIERVQEGVAAWDRLKQDAGFDLRGVFRRRALIPLVLVPRRVAAKHGSAEKLSLLKNLEQAHDAFVFGAPYSALALMRSVVEAILRDHYRAEGRDLSERIRNARGRLPRRANDAALHRLRKLANAVLHLDGEDDQGLRKMDEVRLEKEIVSLLFVVRALIEDVR